MSPARHAANRPHSALRRWALRAALVSTASTIGLVATGVVFSPAEADAPLKVAYWSAGGSGMATTAPDTPAGGMRVAVAPQKGVVSFGAIEYSLPIDGSGTIELAVTQATPTPPTPPGSPVGFTALGNLQACPTKTDSWKAGDNQDISTAPAFDCNTFHFTGALSDDAKTMTFVVDGAADITPGMMSLAIVPVTTTNVYEAGTDAGTDVTPPYYVDFDKPSANSLQVDAASAPPPSDNPPPPATDTGSSSGSLGTTPTGGGGSVPSVSVPNSTTTVPDSTGQTPVVAGQQPQQSYAAPVAATKPASTSDNRDLLLVLLILVLFGILYTQNATQRSPRLLAGPGAAQPAAAGEGAAVAAAHAGAMAAYLPFLPSRGLGRFAKPRTGPARPLL